MERKNKSLKDRIHDDSIRQIKEKIDSGYFWQDSIPFDANNSLNDISNEKINAFYDSLGFQDRYKREQKIFDLKVLLGNLLQTKKAISISLNVNNYKFTKYNQVSEFIINLVHCLNNKKYITMKTGFQSETQNKKASRNTRIAVSRKLIEYFPEWSAICIYAPKELVILRDDKKQLLDYKETAETWRIRDILKLVNKVNAEATIEFENDKLNAVLTAIFKNKFTMGGRLYTKGYRHHQGFSGANRKEITINGESIVELDYSGLHPNLLYSAEGIQYFGDPYKAIDNRGVLRDFLKMILLCLINSKIRVQAISAANFWLYEHKEEKAKLENEIGAININEFVDKFFEVHKKISHYFCNENKTGLRSMNKDAKIALDIINHFGKQNIPCLPIHDSFIVQEKYRDELKSVMQNTYKKHTGFRIKIKE